jgi:hypothetical protein
MNPAWLILSFVVVTAVVLVLDIALVRSTLWLLVIVLVAVAVAIIIIGAIGAIVLRHHRGDYGQS